MYTDVETTENDSVIVVAAQPAAFGETMGLDVPTRYGESTHELFNHVMAADSVLTPMLLGMSAPTVWACRGLAALLFLTRRSSENLTLRQTLQIETATGLLVMFGALRGITSRRWWENAYLFLGGVIMVANALMTEVEDVQ